MKTLRKTDPLAWIVALMLLAPASGSTAERHDDEHADAASAGAAATRVAGEAAREGEDEGHDEHADEEGGHDEELVTLSPEVLEEFGIELDVASTGWISRHASLPAEVRPNQDRLAHIAPRFPGIVRDVRKAIGDSVRAGTVLAVIESSASLAPYSLKSGIDGVIIAKHITRGEPVSRETQAFLVADLRDVWIDISVYQKDLRLLRIGQPVLVSAGHGLHEAEGVLSYISPVVDEDTRTATARVVLPNPEGRWRPGMFVTARVEVARDQVEIAVPMTAIETIDDRQVIFVAEGEGFEPRGVRLGRAGGSHVEVLSGLSPGETYVKRGGFTLKAELAREELSGGHSH